MDWWLVNFFLGAILSLFLPIVPEFSVLLLLISISLAFFYYSFKLNKPLRASSGLLLGASWMLFNALSLQQVWQENQLDALKLASKTQWLQGQVLSLYSPIKKRVETAHQQQVIAQRLRFNFKVTHLNNQKLETALKLRLSWKQAAFPLQQGQTAQLKVKLKPAHGLANLGGFSYQTWLNSSGISGTGYVVNDKNNQLLSAEKSIRQALFNRYKNHLPNHPLAPLLLALGFGSRSDLSPEVWQVLQATGTGHLIAISGLHIGLVATASYFLITLFIRCFPLSFFSNSHSLQTINTRYFAIGLSMIVALSYGYLAGFSLPTIRALMMLSLFWLIRLLAINISLTRWLLLTLFLLTLLTPFSLFTASFWLSVYAVVVIFLTLWRFKKAVASGTKWWRFIKGLLVIQLSLTLLLLPVSAIFFQQVSLVALFANIIAVPWMSFVSIPLCLLSVIFVAISATLSQLLMTICLESVQLLWHYLSYLSSISWATLALSSTAIQLLVFLGLISLVLLFLSVKAKSKLSVYYPSIRALLISVVMIMLTSSFNDSASSKPNHWQLVLFDVGQGLSILIQRQGKAILYDTGAAYASGFNMVEAVILPYLQYAGIKKLDKVIISHGDNDHAGGLALLQQAIVINELIYNVNKNSKKGGKSENVKLTENHLSRDCIKGKLFHWQGLTLEVLWPENNVAKENDDSCVLLISDNQHQVLLAGDISKTVEHKLMQQYPQLQSDVFIVPHHGSKTSSSEAFITQLNPKLALVSAGFLNRWQMPVLDVVKRYQSRDIPLLNSATSGQIIVNFSKKGITTQTYRDDLWPFWFAN